jgi:hypothetical protein
LPHNHLQHWQYVGQEVAADSAELGVETVTEDRG